MVQLFISGVGKTITLDVAAEVTCSELHNEVSACCHLCPNSFYLSTTAGNRPRLPLQPGTSLQVIGKIRGGIDFQHREGSRTGGGGNLSQAQAALERIERLRKLALENIDITKDPYILRNHLGTFECKLCLTIHETEGTIIFMIIIY